MQAGLIKLEPIFSPRIWGARSLAPLFPEKSNLAEPIGEAWLTAQESRLIEGPLKGETLAGAWKKMPPEWRGKSAAAEKDFPLLVKFIFTTDKLSIQVHPDDDYARKYEAAAGGRGKTEMWYVIAAEPGAWVRLGFRPGVTRETFRRAIAEGNAEELIERVPVRAGDALFCSAGTVHTIGPGLTLCEIQEYSDLTYRVFDFNRLGMDGKLRTLHLEKAFQAIRFGEQKGGKVEPLRVSRGPTETTFLAACRHFVTEKWEFPERISCFSSPEHFDLLITLRGRGHFEVRGQRTLYGPAQAWLVPAALGAYDLVAEEATSLLRTYVPLRLEDFAKHLVGAGVGEAELARVVYP